MPVGDLLNWDFIMPKYTDKQWENIIKELEKRKQQKKRRMMRDDT
jgi:phosphoribosyl-ATP pyrophosphohydrolase